MPHKLSANHKLGFDNKPSIDTYQGGEKSMIEKATRTLTLVGLIFLVACGEADTVSETSVNAASTTDVEPVKSVSVNLLSTPLDKLAFLGLIVPEVKEAAACPFLSDEAAVAIVKTDWDLKRRETSNESCYWSKNLGFSIKVTVEPLATAKPVRERTYNLETPPVLKDQPEPGSNAVVLYDTAWDKELAYAIAFEQDSKLVMIYVTGMATDATRLTAAAREVADKLPTVPTLDLQKDNAGAFNMCLTWSDADIEAIIGAPVQATLGDLDCKWEAGTGEGLKQIRVTIYSGKSYPWDSVLAGGARDIPGVGERGLMETKRKRTNMPRHVLMNALYDETLVTVTVTDTVSDYEAMALALSNNIDQRFK